MFEHVSILAGLSDATKVKSLESTTTPFGLETPVSTANVLKPVTFSLVPIRSMDTNSSWSRPINSPLLHTSIFERPVMQVQVTLSPGQAARLSHEIEVSPKQVVIDCHIILFLQDSVGEGNLIDNA